MTDDCGWPMRQDDRMTIIRVTLTAGARRRSAGERVLSTVGLSVDGNYEVSIGVADATL